MGLFDSIGGAIGSVVGGIAGQQAGSGDLGEARNAAIVANQILQNLRQVPDISKPLILEQYKQAGILTPEMEQQITAQIPQAISTNPAEKQAQLQALKQFQDRATSGLTSADRAALQQARQQAQGDVTSRLASIDQQMQSRGLADSGTSLASKLSAAQGGANQANSAANQLAGQSQNAAMQAASQLGNLGGAMQAQDFGQQFQQQQAQNEMQRFNVNNQINQQARNVQNSNQAQQYNLGNLQGLQNANVGQANQEQANQLQRQMQQYGAEQNRAIAQSNGLQHLSNNLQDFGNQASQGAYNQWSGIGKGIGGGFQAAFGAPEQPKTVNSNNLIAGPDPSIGTNTQKAAHGGIIHDYRNGGKVQALSANEQPRVPGDSILNDNIHAMVSKDEIVVPASLSKSPFGKHLLKVIDAHNNLKKHVNGES